MRVVVFEDDNIKFNRISSALRDKGVKSAHISRVETLAEFARIANTEFDLCIIDIVMPGVVGGQERSVGKEILKMLDYSGKQKVPVLAITAYELEIEINREYFAARGCIIFDYNNEQMWLQAIDIYISQAREKGRYDFIIFAAIECERRAFLADKRVCVESYTRNGIDHWEFEIFGKSGSIVLLPRMGLVNAAVIVASVLAQFAPSIVAMCGICGGLSANASMGQLLVTDGCWEYQSGKWMKEIFKAEPYQVYIPARTRQILGKMLEDQTLLGKLETGFAGKRRPSLMAQPKLAMMTSGSAVIASQRRLKSVMDQHRKAAGIDMELFGFHRAVEASGREIHVFSAKTVVDLADEAKGDELHEYGSFLSARFTLAALEAILIESNNS